MSYFREILDIEYPSFLNDKNSSLTMLGKEFISQSKIEMIYKMYSLFNNFIVKDGARPDSVAEEVYGIQTMIGL